MAWSGSLEAFFSFCRQPGMAGCLQKALEKMGYEISLEEQWSWQASLPRLARGLEAAGLNPKLWVGLEAVMPVSGKRADVVIAGADRVVVLELKQWRQVEPSAEPGRIRTWLQKEKKDVLHPVLQVAGYLREMKDWIQAVQDGRLKVAGAVWLHNLSRSQLETLPDPACQGQIPVFSAGCLRQLAAFLQQQLRPEAEADRGVFSGYQALQRLKHSPVCPGPSFCGLLDRVCGNGPAVSRWLDPEQSLLYHRILDKIESCTLTGQVILVQGPAGTGKTLVSLLLLAACLEQGIPALWTSGTAGSRQALQAELGQNRDLPPSLMDVILPVQQFGTGRCGQTTVLLVDEAHRLRRLHKAVIAPDNPVPPELAIWQRAPVLDRMLETSRHLILFLDESQTVSLDDACGLPEIREAVACHNRSHPENRKTLTVMPELKPQFRCCCGPGYAAFLDRFLAVPGRTGNGSPAKLWVNEGFEFQVLPTPQAVIRMLEKRKKTGDSTRLCASWCWPAAGQKPEEEGIGFHIGSKFRGIWRHELPGLAEKTGRQVTDTVQSIQGQEADWVGVLIGPDLCFTRGRVRTCPQKRSRNDWLMGGLQNQVHLRKEEERLADRIIRNTCRVLLTRGRKGCFVWCADRSLAEHLSSLLPCSP